jgi:hypothetical protein
MIVGGIDLNRLPDARVAELNDEWAIVRRPEMCRAFVGNLKTGEIHGWSDFAREAAEQKMWMTDPRARRFASLETFLGFVARGCVGEPDGFDRIDAATVAFLTRTGAR